MKIGTEIALVAMMAAVTTAAFAQAPGAEIYKSKCLACHGASGMSDATLGKALKVKPVTDPEVKKMPEAAMIEATKNGMGKMQPFKGKLTDAQIKEAVDYFRSFAK